MVPDALVTKNKHFKSDMSDVVGMSAVPCAVPVARSRCKRHFAKSGRHVGGLDAESNRNFRPILAGGGAGRTSGLEIQPLVAIAGARAKPDFA